MTSLSVSERLHTPDITHTSTKLTKLVFCQFFIIFKYYLNGYSLHAACDTISNFLQ